MKSSACRLHWTVPVVVAMVFGVVAWRVCARGAEDGKPASTAGVKAGVKPSLTVTTTTLLTAEWPLRLSASGDIEPWQEALIGSEINGLRLAEVSASVGDVVRRGQILATFSEVTVKADVAQARASVAEAEAVLAEATANADRARKSQVPGVMSAQQIGGYLASERMALARLEVARAQLTNQEVRLEQTRLVAPDDGVISARAATVGAVVAAGQELFRLIRLNRLEWRAEVPAADLALLRAGLPTTCLVPGGAPVKGTVRMVAPTVSRETRRALVYVDLPADPRLKAGMYTTGEFELGRSNVTALPQSAVIQREGFHYAFCVGRDNRILQTKVEAGRRLGDQVEILSGLGPESRVVASGVAFLADGDTVRVVESPASPTESEP